MATAGHWRFFNLSDPIQQGFTPILLQNRRFSTATGTFGELVGKKEVEV